MPMHKMTLGVPFYGYGFGPEITSAPNSMSYNKTVEAYSGSESVDEWLTPEGKIFILQWYTDYKGEDWFSKADGLGA